jgi:hypothetical protein
MGGSCALDGLAVFAAVWNLIGLPRDVAGCLLPVAAQAMVLRSASRDCAFAVRATDSDARSPRMRDHCEIAERRSQNRCVSGNRQQATGNVHARLRFANAVRFTGTT